MVRNGHPWVLVAPWYRWAQPGVPSAGRGTAPVFQKFAQDRFVNAFLEDPQRSLRFDPAVDEVHEVDFLPVAAPKAARLAGKIATLYPRKPGTEATEPRLRTLGLRKIYLDTHSRHYLVVCELHCDSAGFPSPKAAEACQAGFVVRRRHLSYPLAARPEARAIVEGLVAVEAQLDRRAVAAGGPHAKSKQLVGRVRAMFEGALPSVEALERKQVELREKLGAWKASAGASWVLEGWIPGAEERLGSWQVVEDEPQELREASLPMWPLFADPDRTEHDGRFGTLFFGVLPTASLDTDTAGRARFDDQTTYEVRCFVRRHDPRCPRGTAPDCRGEVVWSAPTERYRLAPQFDLQGTSNRPVTIQMPDLAELAAQALQRPLGRFSPVKVVQPQSLPAAESGSMGPAAICFLSIPLITIVALFVFNLFLPIVTFGFGLWFLLAFKCCLPPHVSLDASLEAKLDAAPPDLDADFSATATLPDGSSVTVDAESLNSDLRTGLRSGFGLDATATAALGALSNRPLADLAGIASSLDDLPDDPASDPQLRNVGAGLAYEPRRSFRGAA